MTIHYNLLIDGFAHKEQLIKNIWNELLEVYLQ
jgi:hypothetical protein